MRREDPALIKRLQKRALDKIIGEELIAQESAKLTIENIDEKVEQKLKDLETKYGTPERVDGYLKRRNLTRESARQSYRARVRVEEYLKQQGVSEPEIPEERVREVYERAPESYSREETVKVSHILIKVDGNTGAEEKEQARKKAEQLQKEVSGSKDFADAARNHSDCNSAAGGGDLGYIKRRYMPKEFESAAFALEEDAVSEVVETKFGYHVIKVLDKQPGGVMPFAEVKGFITKYLQQEESKKKLAAHMEELKSKATIEILLPE